jgi:hypothetical protein
MPTAQLTTTRVGARRGSARQCDIKADDVLGIQEAVTLVWKHEGGCVSIYRS